MEQGRWELVLRCLEVLKHCQNELQRHFWCLSKSQDTGDVLEDTAVTLGGPEGAGTIDEAQGSSQEPSGSMIGFTKGSLVAFGSLGQSSELFCV